MFDLYLMSKKGYAVLETLIQNGHGMDIGRVVGAPDQRVQADYFEEIRDLCAREGVAFAERTDVSKSTSKWSLAISWRWMLEVKNLIVLHDSLIPRYRGYAPLVSALVNGEPEIGVTALLGAAEIDHGDVIAQKSLAIHYPAKISDVIDRVAKLYSEIVLELASQLKATGSLNATPQDHSLATYSLWRDEEDYNVDWTDSAERIERFVNAVGFPYKGASTSVQGERFRIWDVEPSPDVPIENRSPGKVLFVRGGCPIIVCGTGLLKIKRMTNDEGDPALPLRVFRVRFK